MVKSHKKTTISKKKTKNPSKKITQSSLEPVAPKIQHNSFLRPVEDIFDFYDYVLVEKDGKIVGILTRQDLNQELLK